MNTQNEREEYLARRNFWIRQEFEANMMVPEHERYGVMFDLAMRYHLKVSEIEAIVEGL